MKKMLAMILVILPLFGASVFAAGRTVLFPRFVSGSGWTSEFFFTNQGLSTVTGIQVNFKDADGGDLSVVTNIGTGNEFTFNLAAGATKAVRLTPGDTLLSGHVQVLYPDFTSPVRGSEVFRYESNGVVSVEVGMPQQEIGDHFSFPIAIDPPNVYTAIAITNPTTAEQTFVVNLVNSDGTLADTKTKTLGPFAHYAGYIDRDWLFTQLQGTTFTGSISVSSQLGAGVLTLRQDKASFGAVSTDGGPMLLPSFLVTSYFITDADGTTGGANDVLEDAQVLSPLPVRVSGSIGYPWVSDQEPEDEDIYAFNGTAGDILTVICDTTLLGVTSYMDPIVQVLDSNGDELAYNDQNGLAPGLYPLNDSFIQMKLPYTGTYYIVVYDYWTDVGDTTNYKYHLHVRTR
jgi:hypothetical protein